MSMNRSSRAMAVAVALAAGVVVTGVQVSPVSPAPVVAQAQGVERDPKHDKYIKDVEGPNAKGEVVLHRNDGKDFVINVNNGVQNVTYDEKTNTIVVYGPDGTELNKFILRTTTVTPKKDGTVVLTGFDEKGEATTHTVVTDVYINKKVKEISDNLANSTKEISRSLGELEGTLKDNADAIGKIDKAAKESLDTARGARDTAVETRKTVTTTLEKNQKLNEEQIRKIRSTADEALTHAQNAFDTSLTTMQSAIDLGKRYTQESNRINTLFEKIDTVSHQITALDSTLEGFENRLTEAEGALTTARKDLTTLEGKIDANADEIQAQRDKVSNLSKVVDQHRKDFETEQARTEKERETLAKRLTAIEIELINAGNAIVKLNRQAELLQIAASMAQQTADEANANVIVKAERNADNTISLIKRSGEVIGIAAANKYGLQKCATTLGGTLLALAPVGMALAWAAGNSQLPGLDDQIADVQKRLGVYNEDAAQFVSRNSGAIAATLGTIGLLSVAFAPGLCGDQSIASAAKDSLRMGALDSKTPVPDKQWQEAGGMNALSSAKTNATPTTVVKTTVATATPKVQAEPNAAAQVSELVAK